MKLTLNFAEQTKNGCLLEVLHGKESGVQTLKFTDMQLNLKPSTRVKVEYEEISLNGGNAHKNFSKYLDELLYNQELQVFKDYDKNYSVTNKVSYNMLFEDFMVALNKMEHSELKELFGELKLTL